MFTILLIIAIISALFSLYYRYWRSTAFGFANRGAAVKRNRRPKGARGNRPKGAPGNRLGAPASPVNRPGAAGPRASALPAGR